MENYEMLGHCNAGNSPYQFSVASFHVIIFRTKLQNVQYMKTKKDFLFADVFGSFCKYLKSCIIFQIFVQSKSV